MSATQLEKKALIADSKSEAPKPPVPRPKRARLAASVRPLQSTARPGLCFDASCCCLRHGWRYPENGSCCRDACCMLNEQERCHICPCEACHFSCSNFVCVCKRVGCIFVILALLAAVVAWFFIVAETKREERVQLVACVYNETDGARLELWDAKLKDKTFFSPLRRERHANFTLKFTSSVTTALDFASDGQSTWRVEPKDCPGGMQFLILSPDLTNSTYTDEYTPISTSDPGEHLIVH